MLDCIGGRGRFTPSSGYKDHPFDNVNYERDRLLSLFNKTLALSRDVGDVVLKALLTVYIFIH